MIPNQINLTNIEGLKETNDPIIIKLKLSSPVRNDTEKMPAPRCPAIHKPPAYWEKWIEDYLKYDYRVFPKSLRTFDEYKKSRHMYVGENRIQRAWKYYAYLELTCRKHRTLTI